MSVFQNQGVEDIAQNIGPRNRIAGCFACVDFARPLPRVAGGGLPEGRQQSVEALVQLVPPLVDKRGVRFEGKGAQADQILVLKSGRMESLGRHEELIRVSPTYQVLHEMQMEGRTT